MLTSDSDVSDLLGRVMSRAPAPKAAEEKKPLAPGGEPTATARSDIGEWRLPGISGETRVTTNFGKVPAQLVRVGDHLRTRSGRFLQVVRISETKLDFEFLERHPEARPVVLKKGTLGSGCPAQDIFLSPAQCVNASGRLDATNLPTAKELSQTFKAIDRSLGMVAYYRFELEATDAICCEGVWIMSPDT